MVLLLWCMWAAHPSLMEGGAPWRGRALACTCLPTTLESAYVCAGITRGRGNVPHPQSLRRQAARGTEAAFGDSHPIYPVPCLHMGLGIHPGRDQQVGDWVVKCG